MILPFVILLLLLALSIDVLWLPALFGAVAAMHWTASLHLPDPLAPLYAFCASGVIGRLGLGLVLDRATRTRRRSGVCDR